MEFATIECSKIKIPKTDKKVRTLNREFAAHLSNSIRTDGLLIPIGVRRDPENPGRYILVHGRHRIHAVAKILKQPTIDCHILDMDEVESELASIAENLWRIPTNKSQHLVAHKRWLDSYIARNPEPESPQAVGGRAKAVKMAWKTEQTDSREQPHATDTEPATESESAEAGSPDESPVEKPPTVVGDTGSAGFTRQLMAATGFGRRHARRETKILKAFNADQVEALVQTKVPMREMVELAGIEDVAQRDAAVNLIASGLNPQEAIQTAAKNFASRQQSPPATESEKTSTPETKADLSDDDWFAATCGEKSPMFAGAPRYQADAILYRRIMAQRASFRTKAFRFMNHVPKDMQGPFFKLVKRMLTVSHPSEWSTCGTCGGRGANLMLSGLSGTPGSCPRCRGCGYELNTEEYR